jgi:hypothetical protein
MQDKAPSPGETIPMIGLAALTAVWIWSLACVALWLFDLL